MWMMCKSEHYFASSENRICNFTVGHFVAMDTPDQLLEHAQNVRVVVPVIPVTLVITLIDDVATSNQGEQRNVEISVSFTCNGLF
jgi:hypothetical protein